MTVTYRHLFFLLILCFPGYPSFSQKNLFTPSDTLHPARLKWVAFTTAGVYTAGMTGLYQIWYKDYELTRFHLFNDFDEWYFYDKAGHVASSYYLSRWGMGLYRWTGLSPNQSVWIGGTIGLAFMTTIEVFDGFSSEWGFSISDFSANVIGTGIAIAQQQFWKEQRISFKYSYSLKPSPYARYRPDLFGTSFPERLVKDYNGQTVWMTANIRSFIHSGSSIPGWLNLAAGYGIDGLTGAFSNITEFNGIPVPPFVRKRQFYLSPDIDFSKIKTQRRGVKLLFSLLGFIKVPAPAIELDSKMKFRFHWLHF